MMLRNVYKHGRMTQSLQFYHSEKGVYGSPPVTTPRSTFTPEKDHKASRLLAAFQDKGHIYAKLNPLQNYPSLGIPEQLKPEFYHISGTEDIEYKNELLEVNDLVGRLSKIYCGTAGFEFSYLENEEEKDFLHSTIESVFSVEFSDERKVQILKEMLKSQSFDNFLASKFSTVKRYGGEGAESIMPFFTELFYQAGEKGITDIVCAMAHRGRLNLLTGMLNFPPSLMFRKMKGLSEFPANYKTIGDVLSHLTSSTDIEVGDSKVHFTMVPNPSHLEAANPVAVGKARARQQSLNKFPYSPDGANSVLCLQVHGDAAMAGQGVIQETLAIAQVPHYSIGGSLHLAVNNQVGYTTPGSRGRSSRYCTDVAKMIDAPVIHVNGDDPEAVARATRVAIEYQQTFKKDIFVDLVCYRRWGHNELDDPTFTNPLMYKVINNRETVPDRYANQLISKGVVSKEKVDEIVDQYTQSLGDAFRAHEEFPPPTPCFEKQWVGLEQPSNSTTYWDTGMDPQTLKYIGVKSVQFPEDFDVHHHLLKTHIKNRILKLEENGMLDWATCEALAIGSLLHQGFNVRISGQDVGRGTFSQRHAMLVDQTSGQIFIPFNDLDPAQKGYYEVANSILSEEAVLGFEYGVSIENPNILCLWEAQFGDFFNGAQIMIDTFVTSGEAKWLLQSCLTMLLPHGYDGAGPEHSSCRIERFLQLTDSSETQVDGDDVNCQIVNPTTPAQYFHLLRRQMIRNYRKPMIVAAPKILLRLAAATSSLDEMGPGTTFQPILGDNTVDPKNVTKVVFVSGKHYYALLKQRETLGAKDVALIRVEELCPFPTAALQSEIKKYAKATSFVWNQEEPRNMGAWSFVSPRFENLVGKKLVYVGRKELPAPAVGIGMLNKKEIEDLNAKSF